jgi:hypothetical protein
MKKILVTSALALACVSAFAQSAAISGSNSSAGSVSGATASGGTNQVGVNTQQGQQQQEQQQVGQTVNFNSTGSNQMKTVGNPGAVSYGVSFSQYNCANTAAIGGGWLGGVLQLGGPLESGPCNARANASALFQLSQALATSNPAKSAQLFNAAVLLLGNSTTATQQALQTAGVKDWNPSEPSQHSDAPSSPAVMSQNCPGGYCGTDPLVRARLGLQ